MNQEQNQIIQNNIQGEPSANFTLRYAGFGSRLAASLLDGLALFGIAAIIFFVMTILNIFLKPTGEIRGILILLQYVLPMLVIMLGMFFYRGLKDPKGKTFGRKITKTIVKNEDGSEITVGMSFLRQLLRTLINSVGITVIIDFILILTDEKKQTIADKILKTVVVYK